MPQLWLLIWRQVSSIAKYGFVYSTIDKYCSGFPLLHKWYNCEGCARICDHICTKAAGSMLIQEHGLYCCCTLFVVLIAAIVIGFVSALSIITLRILLAETLLLATTRQSHKDHAKTTIQRPCEDHLAITDNPRQPSGDHLATTQSPKRLSSLHEKFHILVATVCYVMTKTFSNFVRFSHSTGFQVWTHMCVHFSTSFAVTNIKSPLDRIR